MNRVLPTTRPTATFRIFVVALACSLTLSGCASPVAPSAKPANFYETVRSDVEKFWPGFFSSHGLGTYSLIAKMQLFDSSQVGSACGEISSNVAPLYCIVDRSVYLPSGFMQTQLSDFGDFGSAVVIAHEIGHHVQNLLGFNASITLHELQADCLAGGWMKDAKSRGLLQVSDPLEAAGSLFSVGDPVASFWFQPNRHGSPQQRVEAFQLGFNSGAESCFQ
jgi:predicted metalloprotease